MLRCHLCGKEYFHDGKICRSCEETIASHRRTSVNKWRCDGFLELNSLPFGCNLEGGDLLGPKLVECPECGEEYSYGRKISHTCKNNSITFGKIFEIKCGEHKWNCNTAMACMELLESELDSVESVVEITPRLEKLEITDYKWNEIRFNVPLEAKKSQLIYE
ncbi:MAG: hypothetical protein ACFFCC_15890 [Promethearchaeota archaeon]